ncbi:MAG: hypothetical protein FJ216_04970 [Ignavibacteria bacterium]|nr:hypothetical protein [Ignavibacteria bacterium]
MYSNNLLILADNQRKSAVELPELNHSGNEELYVTSNECMNLIKVIRSGKRIRQDGMDVMIKSEN